MLGAGGGGGTFVRELLRVRLGRVAGAWLVGEGWEGADLDRVSRLAEAVLVREPAWMERRVEMVEPWVRPMSESEASPWR